MLLSGVFFLFSLLHAGKGLITFNPLHSNNMLLSKTGAGGLLTLLVSCLDFKNSNKIKFLVCDSVCVISSLFLSFWKLEIVCCVRIVCVKNTSEYHYR